MILSQLLDKRILLLLVHALDADSVHSYDYVVGLSRVSDAKQNAGKGDNKQSLHMMLHGCCKQRITSGSAPICPRR
jgi:hypothetical protein